MWSGDARCTCGLTLTIRVSTAIGPRALQEACSMSDLCDGLAKVSRDDWTVGGWSCNEAEQAILLLALGERALAASESVPTVRIDRDL
jgi:hypothetical protein